MKSKKNKSPNSRAVKQARLATALAFSISSLLLALSNISLYAQTGASQMSTAIENSKTDISGIFQSLSDVILVIGAIVGLVGGIQVFVKWNRGERDINKEIAAWGGSCVFLLIMGTILKTAFGL
ncbi:MAG: DUF4134 domain-containing protein [Bacteroidetes bacterium]|nr:DUF4134 domain-containing protein [Bacteroidota bacterium]